MISLFGEDLLTKTEYGNSKGLVYTDDEWKTAFEFVRKQGILPGRAISSTVVNTALRQSIFAYYVLLDTIINKLSLDITDETDSSEIADKFYTYIKQIQDIKQGSWVIGSLIGRIIPKCNAAQNYFTSGNINSSFSSIYTKINYFIDGTDNNSEVVSVGTAKDYVIPQEGENETLYGIYEGFKDIENGLNEIDEALGVDTVNG